MESDNVILKAYQQRKNMTEEEKQVEQWYAQWCIANGLYDHMTDKQIDKLYRKNYLGEQV